jgi:hypothetical protein
LMEAANAVVPKITPAQARDMIVMGNTLVVDVRDAIAAPLNTIASYDRRECLTR